MNLAFGILFISIFPIAGIALIFGTYRKWDWLVDPPDDWACCYSHSFLKKIFGKRFLIYFNYTLGAAFIVLSIVGLANGLK